MASTDSTTETPTKPNPTTTSSNPIETTSSETLDNTNTKSNLKKRKLTEYNSDSNNNEPDRKKRKFNEKTLLESTTLLEKQNEQLKQENDKLSIQRDTDKQTFTACKQEADKWKAKYMQLYSQLTVITNEQMHATECDIELNNNFDDYSELNGNLKNHKNSNNSNNSVPTNKNSNSNSSNTNSANPCTKYDTIRDRLLEMGFNKAEVTNKISQYCQSNESPQFVFNEIIESFTPDQQQLSPLRLLRSHSKGKGTEKVAEQRPIFNDIEYNYDVDFENSYYISVNCHICRQHFDDIDEYKCHLEKHYEHDPDKVWKQCDFTGCDNNPTTPSKFIGHISTHTHDGPYMCNVITNGIKCNKSSGYKSELKSHWKKYHLRTIQNNLKIKRNIDSDSEMDQHENENVSVKKKKRNKKKRRNKYKVAGKNDNKIHQSYKRTRSMNQIETTNNMAEYTEFSESYHVSINCHICSAHFSDFDKYKSHLQKHYENDNDKVWRRCDLGCTIDPQKPLFNDNLVFISHIAQHTKDKPFKCDVVINGIRCQSTFGERKNLRGHWKTHFNSRIRNGCGRPISRESHESEESDSDFEPVKKIKPFRSDVGSINDIEFEDSYHISIECHICSKHFDNYEKYEQHLKTHYDSDANKVWKQCDLGCKINPEKPLFVNNYLFISHIANHTKNKPFKCDFMVNGIKCRSSCGSKNNLKLHWKKHLDAVQNENNNCSVVKTEKKRSRNNKKKNISNNKRRSPSRKRVIPSALTDKDFEDCFYISVDCHICEKHFDDLYEYRDHIKEHYDNDHLRKWLHCDMGCKNRKDSSTAAFTYHIAQHTKNYPFKCSVMVNGKECPRTSGQKSDMKRHWQATHLPKKTEKTEKKRGNRKRSDYYVSESEGSEYESSSISSFETESVHSIPIPNDNNNINFDKLIIKEEKIKMETNNVISNNNKVYEELSDRLSGNDINDISSSSYYSSTTSDSDNF